MLQILKDGASTILGIGATELLTASGIDISPYDKMSFIIKNTGAANLTNLSVYWLDSFTNTDWSPADNAIALPGGILIPGDTVEITVTDLSRTKMRMTVTGTNLETVGLTLAVVWRS